jgi:hypothetical protein
VEPIKLESGYDFITFYFKNAADMNHYSKQLYNNLMRFAEFPYRDLQRTNFKHLPGDIPHFHAHEEAPSPHFHILYEDRPTKADWELLYIWGNRRELELNRNKNIEIVS